MQIREMSLKELDVAYEVLHQLRNNLSFKEFDDLVYEMRHMDYKMIGLFQRDKLISYAGIAIQTSFEYKRHLYIYDLVTDELYRKKGYAKEMFKYLEVYAKTAMCENIVLCIETSRLNEQRFYENLSCVKKGTLYFKTI